MLQKPLLPEHVLPQKTLLVLNWLHGCCLPEQALGQPVKRMRGF